jgi:hypothetical protein
MTTEQAKKTIGSRAEWELKHIIKALSAFPILNTPEDNERLKAARVLLAAMRRGK